MIQTHGVVFPEVRPIRVGLNYLGILLHSVFGPSSAAVAVSENGTRRNVRRTDGHRLFEFRDAIVVLLAIAIWMVAIAVRK